MKLQSLAVIFVIIIIPIILVFSYYISLQVDTISMQTSYNTKLLDSTKEAIEAFEINTVEWNNAYSQTADSKRRDIMASINTFTTSFANSLGISGANKEDILTYVPAIACTLYDGYYIYSPAETREVIKDENGVVEFMTEDLAKNRKSGKISGYKYNSEDEGKILYEAKENSQGVYNNGISKNFTLNPDDAKTTYSHILKPFASYSARYKTDNIDIIVNYTLDNYITIYGTIGNKYQIKSGYLSNTNDKINLDGEELSEKIWYKGIEKGKFENGFTYVYADDNTKVYFDGDTTFQVSAAGERTNLSDSSQKYKAIVNEDGTKYYQALSDYTVKSGKKIEKGAYYTEKENPDNKINVSTIKITKDVSARNYYYESKRFTKWVSDNLKNITIEDMQNVEDKSKYGDTSSQIFNISAKNDPEDEGSIFNMHKKEVIRQSLISDLNQAITSYSRNAEGDYQLPILTDTDWDHIFRNVSIITFVQNIPIGMKYYNNYAVATSTSNKEYVNPDGIYLSSGDDPYYHMPYCDKLIGDNIIGYRNIDYTLKSYETDEKDEKGNKIKYYYKHEYIANQLCYYCLVQRSLYNESNGDKRSAQEIAYKTALAREKYNNRKTRIDIVKAQTPDPIPTPEPKKFTITFDANGGEGNIPERKELANTVITLPSMEQGFTKDGYMLEGWEDRETGETYGAGAEYIVNKDRVLYAKWKKEIPRELNLTIRISPSETSWQTTVPDLKSNLYLTYDLSGQYKTRIYYTNSGGNTSEYYDNGYVIYNPWFATGTSGDSKTYNVTIETTDANGNVYRGNVDIISTYWWNGAGIFFGEKKFKKTLSFERNLVVSSTKVVSLNLVQ